MGLQFRTKKAVNNMSYLSCTTRHTPICSTNLDENHGGYFFSCESLVLAGYIDNNMGLVVFVYSFEREILDVVLDVRIGPRSAYHPFGIEYRVCWVGGQLVLGGVTNQPITGLNLKGNVGWSDPVSLVIGNDLNTAVLKHSHTET